MKKDIYIYDIETFSNCFSMIAERKRDGKIFEFIIGEDDKYDGAEDFALFLENKPVMVGYNNLAFDGQVVQHIWDENVWHGPAIYEFVQSTIIEGDKMNLPYKMWEFKFPQIDLMNTSKHLNF